MFPQTDFQMRSHRQTYTSIPTDRQTQFRQTYTSVPTDRHSNVFPQTDIQMRSHRQTYTSIPTDRHSEAFPQTDRHKRSHRHAQSFLQTYTSITTDRHSQVFPQTDIQKRAHRHVQAFLQTDIHKCSHKQTNNEASTSMLVHFLDKAFPQTVRVGCLHWPQKFFLFDEFEDVDTPVFLRNMECQHLVSTK